MNKLLIIGILLLNLKTFSQEVAIAKYSGGGDWYANPTSLPNLVKFCNQNINTKINTKIATVAVGSSEIFTYPFVHMTGHGNVVFSPNDVINLRNYLTSGGFLHIDDNYGMDEFIRKEIKKFVMEYAWFSAIDVNSACIWRPSKVIINWEDHYNPQ